MLHAMRKRMGDDKGFTLIELMVVVLIIAILIAIAIPTFLGLRSRAQNRSAHSDIRNALTAAKAFYTDADTYNGFDATDGAAIEPALTWNASGASPAKGEVSVREASGTTVLVTAQSETGTFFGIADVAGVTKYCKSEAPDTLTAASACTGTSTAAWA